MYHVCSQASVHTPKLHATVSVHANFLSFICGKRAGTHIYLHMCVKFKLSCIIAQLQEQQQVHAPSIHLVTMHT